MTVLRRVLLGRVFSMLDGMQLMTMCKMRMYPGLLVVARSCVGCSFTMMLGRMFVMLRCFFVMLMDVVLVHVYSPRFNSRSTRLQMHCGDHR